MTQKSGYRILLVLPLLLFGMSLATTGLQGPLYYGRNIDPEYPYLLNALNVATLRAPALYGHPGTTLQVIEAAILLIKWIAGCCLTGPSQTLREAVLSHPEDYLHTINVALNGLLAIGIYVVAHRIYRLTASFITAFVFQLSFGMFQEAFHAQARVSPEPMLAISVMVVAFPLSELVFAQRTKSPVDTGCRYLNIKVGAALAFGIVTKITFAPLAAILLLFRRRRPLVAVLVSTLVVGLTLLFPIWSDFSRMYSWFTSLLVHTERYGNGPVGFPSGTVMLSRVLTIVRSEPVLPAALVLYAALYGAFRLGWIRASNPAAVRVKWLLLAGVVAISLQMAITVKHFAMHYLLPAMIFTMLVNAGAVFLLRESEPGMAARILSAALLLLLAIGAWNSYRGVSIWLASSDQYRTDIASILQRRRELKECSVIGYYRSSLPEFALSFGDDWTGNLYGREIEKLYPRSIHYNIWARQFYSPQGELNRDELRNAIAGGSCVLMEGTTLSPQEITQVAGFSLRSILTAGNETLYRLSLNAGTVVISNPDLPADTIAIDARSFTSGNVVIDNSQYGKGIGAIVSPSYPAHVEYKVALKSAGRYELWIRCASADARPVTISINGATVDDQGCPASTGGFGPDYQKWQGAGSYPFTSGVNTIHLERSGPIPVINKLALCPK